MPNPRLTTDIIGRLRREGRDPQTLIDLARREGLTRNLDADMVADIAVPDEERLPEDHPDYMTDRDPWSLAWDMADDILHPENQRLLNEMRLGQMGVLAEELKPLLPEGADIDVFVDAIDVALDSGSWEIRRNQSARPGAGAWHLKKVVAERSAHTAEQIAQRILEHEEEQ